MKYKPTIKYEVDNKLYLHDIQIFRGIAVLAVVLFHVSDFFSNGYLGVNLFFVISGFVIFPRILEITHGKRFVDKIYLMKVFYLKRFFRLVPAMSVTIIFSSIVIISFCETWIFERLVQQGIASFLLLGNIGAYRYSGGDYFDINPNPLIHLWSLSAEEQIYIFVPILFLIIFSFRKHRKIVDPKLILLALFVLGFVSQYYIFPNTLGELGFRNVNGLIFYLPSSHIWEFAVGGLAYLARSSSHNIFNKTYFKVFGVICLFSLITVIYCNFSFILEPLLVTLLTSVVIISKAINLHSSKLTNILLWIGDRSYSIYLCHMPIIYFFHYSPYVTNLSTLISNFLIFISILLTTITLFNNFEQKYRGTHARNSDLSKLLVRNIIKFIALPLITLLMLLFWTSQTKWVLNESNRPVYASTTDTKCERLSSGNPCWYPAVGSRNISLLIGDSVSTGYADTFVAKSNLNGTTAVTLTLAGCQFITRNSVSSSKYSVLTQNFNVKWAVNQKTCFDHNEGIIEFIKKYRPEKVFLSQHTVNQDYSYLDISKFDLRELRIRNIIELNQITKKLVVIGAPPLLNSNISIAEQTLFKVFGDSSNVKFDKLQPDFIIEEEYMKLSSAKYGINYVSLKPIFCDKRICKVFEKNWLYFDTTHLSTLGARKLFDIF